MPGQVITLQFGNYSNFVASHFWNLQHNCFYYSESASAFGLEFDHDVFFREGLSPRDKKITYNPRSVLVDLKGYTRTASIPIDKHYLDEVDSDQHIWDGQVDIHKPEVESTSAGAPTKSQELGDTEPAAPQPDPVSIAGWPGYLAHKFHPKSMVINKHFSMDNPSEPFIEYVMGQELFSREMENFEESVRWFAEDCDYLRSFNLMVDADTGMTGFTVEALEFLNDQYDGKSKLVWNCFDPPEKNQVSARSLNALLSYAVLDELTDLIVPLFFPSNKDCIVNYKRKYLRSKHHLKEKRIVDTSFFTSAAIATMIDSVLSSCKFKPPIAQRRWRDSPGGIPGLATSLTLPTRKFVVGYMACSPHSHSKYPLQMEAVSSCDNQEVARGLAVVRGFGTESDLEIQRSKLWSELRLSISDPNIESVRIDHPIRVDGSVFPENVLVENSAKTILPDGTASDLLGSGFQLFDGLHMLLNSKGICKHFSEILGPVYGKHLNRINNELKQVQRGDIARETVESALNSFSKIYEEYR